MPRWRPNGIPELHHTANTLKTLGDLAIRYAILTFGIYIYIYVLYGESPWDACAKTTVLSARQELGLRLLFANTTVATPTAAPASSATVTAQ